VEKLVKKIRSKTKSSELKHKILLSFIGQFFNTAILPILLAGFNRKDVFNLNSYFFADFGEEIVKVMLTGAFL
jgi:hypothetical protein